MCERALTVKNAFVAFIMEEKKLEAEFLTATDWEYLTNLARFFKPFRYITKANKDFRDSIDRILFLFEFLLTHFERWRKDYGEDDWFGKRIDAAHQKLKKYYTKSDNTLAYMTVTVFNSQLKW